MPTLATDFLTGNYTTWEETSEELHRRTIE
jgi:hypothetical protein